MSVDSGGIPTVSHLPPKEVEGCLEQQLYPESFKFRAPEGAQPFIVEMRKLFLSDLVLQSFAGQGIDPGHVEAGLANASLIYLHATKEIKPNRPYFADMFVLALYIKGKPYQVLCRQIGPKADATISIMSLVELTRDEEMLSYRGQSVPGEWRYAVPPPLGTEFAGRPINFALDRQLVDGSQRVSLRSVKPNRSFGVELGLYHWTSEDYAEAIQNWDSVVLVPNVSYQSQRFTRIELSGSIHGFPGKITLYSADGGQAKAGAISLTFIDVPSRPEFKPKNGVLRLNFPYDVIPWAIKHQMKVEDFVDVVTNGIIQPVEDKSNSLSGDFEVLISHNVRGEHVVLRLWVERENKRLYVSSVSS